jgi:hypothetical protein
MLSVSISFSPGIDDAQVVVLALLMLTTLMAQQCSALSSLFSQTELSLDLAELPCISCRGCIGW